MISHTLTRNTHGERVLTLTLVGDYAIGRLGTLLLRAGCDFADVGRAVLRVQRRAERGAR